MSQDADASLVVYADYVCPFCYLGKRSLDRYRADSDVVVAVDWYPFDLRSHKRGPDGEIDDGVDDGKDAAYFDRVREQVERLRAEYGASEMLGIDEVPDVDSLDAQVASHYVQECHRDDWRAFDDALYAALWEDGRDLGDPDVLAAVGDSVGVEGAEIRKAIRDEERRETVFAAFDAAQQEGITGVPTFQLDGMTARGAVPPERLAALVEGTDPDGRE